jgi:agmatine/peptidylarginine deiminase
MMLSVSLFIRAQEHEIQKYHSTHHLSPEEKALMQKQTRSFTETDPPVGEVRNIAEWEPMESVLIAYDGGFGIPLSLIAEMSQDCGVTTIVSNASEENNVMTIFNNNGVNTANCTFVHQDPNTYWTRDYSPWYITVDNSEVAIINFPYNRPRPNDNDVPILMANELGIDLYGMNIEHTGGNYMCDGYGAAASTDLVWEENTNQTTTDIDQKVLDYMGIQTYHVTLDPLDDYIKHIDCWGKFLDVDKILITEVPVTDYRYDDYEAVASYFAGQNCSWGYPYEVIRVQSADYYEYEENPYTNSLILNNKVFVPQTGSDLDDDAIAVYEAAMPNYEIIGVYSTSWINSDALHCRTHGIPDRSMLDIRHMPIQGDLEFQEYYTVEAEVFSIGGAPISANYPKLYYRTNEGDWISTTMNFVSGTTYTADIPAMNGENTVDYYIEAQNDAGKYRVQPLTADFDPHTFSYSGGNIGISEEMLAQQVQIYPNPSNGHFVLKTPFQNSRIAIYNLNGQLMQKFNANLSTLEINTNIPAGIYVVEINSDAYSISKKLIIH